MTQGFWLIFLIKEYSLLLKRNFLKLLNALICCRYQWLQFLVSGSKASGKGTKVCFLLLFQVF